MAGAATLDHWWPSRREVVLRCAIGGRETPQRSSVHRGGAALQRDHLSIQLHSLRLIIVVRVNVALRKLNFRPQ